MPDFTNTSARSAHDDDAPERIAIRTRRGFKNRVRQAAELRGVDISSFLLMAAGNLADQVIGENERTRLQPIDHAAFFDAMDDPEPANERLTAALIDHRDNVVSR